MTTLLSLVEALARDPGAKADYASGPDDYLARHGFGELSPADVNEAVHHASDALPPAAAAQVEPGDGLASVAEVDPDAFEPGVATTFEDDLFGLDPVDDELEPAAAGFDPTSATHEDSDGAPLTGDGDDRGAGRDHGREVHDDDAPDAVQRLSTLPDPNDLDGDELMAAGHGAAAGAPATATGGGQDGRFPGTETEPAGLTSADAPDEDIAAGFTDGGADASLEPTSFSPDDPFATADPLRHSGDDPWYEHGTSDGYGVEPPEPPVDILDDVDDIDLDGS